MKKIKLSLALVLSLMAGDTAFGQSTLKVNTPPSNADAIAVMSATDPDDPTNKEGLIIPRVNAFPGNAASLDAGVGPGASSKGMMVYLQQAWTGDGTAPGTTAAQVYPVGFYYWSGTAWTPVGSGSGWALTGNSGTTPGTNYIGTTDAQDFVTKTAGAERMRVTSAGNVGIGTAGPGPSAILELQSDTSALLITRVANTAAVTSPSNGMIIYDMSSNCLKGYQNGKWSDCLVQNVDPSTGGTATVVGYDCTNSTASGTLTVGSPATGVTQTIPVSVGTVGTYNITTSSANGITFSGSGTFTATGAAVVTLYATGTPAAAGSNIYTLNTTPGCGFSRTAGVSTHPSSGGTAVVSAWNCTGTDAGTLQVGIPASGVTHTVTATVTTIGTYNVSTTTASGVIFSGSGTFAGTGAQSITLTATGTPTNSGTAFFSLTTNPNCTFSRSINTAATFNCSGIATTQTPLGALQNGTAYTGTVSIPYTAGSGASYGATTIGPNSGLTLTRVAGTYAAGGGNVIYNLSGTYTGASNGTVTFTGFPECSSSSVLFGDAIRGALTTSGPAYDAAANNTWIPVTASEYANLLTTVASSNKYLATDATLASTTNAIRNANYTEGALAKFALIPASSYVIAFTTKTSNAGTVSGFKVKIIPTNLYAYAQYGSTMSGVSFAAQSRTYWVIKRPNTTTLSSAASPFGLYTGTTSSSANVVGDVTPYGTEYNGYGDSYSATSSWSANAAIQVIATGTKQW